MNQQKFIMQYLNGTKPLNEIRKKLNISHWKADKIISSIIKYGEPYDSNWLYNIRMKEAEEKRKKNFTEQEIKLQII